MKFEITKYLCPHNEKDCPAYKEFVNKDGIQITTTESGERVFTINTPHSSGLHSLCETCAKCRQESNIR